MQRPLLGHFLDSRYLAFLSKHPVWWPFRGQAHLVVSRMQTGRTLETRRQSAPSRDWQVHQRSHLYPAGSAKSSRAKILWTSKHTWTAKVIDGSWRSFFQPEPSTSVLTWREFGAANERHEGTAIKTNTEARRKKILESYANANKDPSWWTKTVSQCHSLCRIE